MNLNWKTKWSDSARDYGNGNSAETGGNYRDMRLPSYAVSDLELDFLYGDYKSFINLTNLFNKKYSQAVQFSAPERALNFGFKKVY